MKAPISIAPRYNPRSGESDNSFGVSSSNVNSGNTQSAAEKSAVIEQQQQVDSALYNALTNPRERMAVFQMENTIMAFVKTG